MDYAWHMAVTDRSHLAQMQAMIEGSRFLEIEQAGHISNIEKPDIFNDAVVRFIDEAERAAASAD